MERLLPTWMLIGVKCGIVIAAGWRVFRGGADT
jgi:hypothetical protein